MGAIVETVMAKSREDIEADVRDVLVDALGVDEDDVVPTATLKGDLGAESIDYLDIVFPIVAMLKHFTALIHFVAEEWTRCVSIRL